MSNNLVDKIYTINTTGITNLATLGFKPTIPSTFTFSVVVSAGAVYTLLTGIASNGTLVPDDRYNNYTTNCQDTAHAAGAFGISVSNLGTSGSISIELKNLT